MLLEPSSHHNAARSSLQQAHKPGRVILVHTGIVLLVSLLLTVADFLLDQQIGTTGGLGGMGTRSVLTTIQSLLRLAQLVILPFWEIGYTYYTLKTAQGQSSGLSDLLEGFRRFGPILRLKMLIFGISVLLVFVCSYLSSFIFMVTPWAAPLMEEMEALLVTNPDEAALVEFFLSKTDEIAIPLMIILLVCLLAGSLLLFFRYRLAELWLLAHPDRGALAALRISKELMKGNWKGMLRIDLHFWWFYLLEILVTALCFGDLIMSAVGFEMTADAFTHYLIFFALYIWAQMSLYWWKRNEVCVTYAHAFLSLCPTEEEQKLETVQA